MAYDVYVEGRAGNYFIYDLYIYKLFKFVTNVFDNLDPLYQLHKILNHDYYN